MTASEPADRTREQNVYASLLQPGPLLENLPVLPDGLEIEDGGFQYTKDFTKSESVKKIGQFFPGGVPVFVEGKIEGAVNIAHTRLWDRLDEVPKADTCGEAPKAEPCPAGERP